MGRARLLKPGFFTNELLAELPYEGRLLFAGLWTLADREGRLEERVKRIKAAVFPFDEVDVLSLLIALEVRGFIDRYMSAGMALIQVAKFSEHQTPFHREPASTLPPPDEPSIRCVHGDHTHTPCPPVLVQPVLVQPDPVLGAQAPRSARRADPPVLIFPTAGRPDSWDLHDAQITEWQELYQGLDVIGECRKALAWVRSNVGHKKTAGGMPRFLVNWFNRSVDRRGSVDRRPDPRLGPAPERRWRPEDCMHTPGHDNGFDCDQRTKLDAMRGKKAG